MRCEPAHVHNTFFYSICTKTNTRTHLTINNPRALRRINRLSCILPLRLSFSWSKLFISPSLSTNLPCQHDIQPPDLSCLTLCHIHSLLTYRYRYIPLSEPLYYQRRSNDSQQLQRSPLQVACHAAFATQFGSIRSIFSRTHTSTHFLQCFHSVWL